MTQVYIKEKKNSFQNTEFPTLIEKLSHTRVQHGTKKWNPQSASFLTGSRNEVFLFDQELSLTALKKVFFLLNDLHLQKGHLLFVNTSPKYNELLRETSSQLNACGLRTSLMNDRWVGGSLTNWKQSAETVYLFEKFSTQFDVFLRTHHLQVPRYQKLKKRFGEFKVFGPTVYDPVSLHSSKINVQGNLPDVLFVIDPDENTLLLREAKRFQIPVIGFVDSKALGSQMMSQSDVSIDYFIFSNTKSLSFLYFCLNLLVTALKRVR